MLAYIAISAWGICILLAWIGWGSLVNATLVRDPDLDWAQRGAWGLSLLIILGGVLDALCLVSRPAVLSLLGLGLLFWGAEVIRRAAWRQLSPDRAWAAVRAHKLASIVALLVVSVIAARYLGFVHTNIINPHDDCHGYLVFPTRMLDAGCIGEEPFNHRRLVSGLGGKCFLDTFVLGVGSVFNLHLIDAGLGLLLTAGLLIGALRRRAAGPLASSAIVLLAALLPPPRVNMTALMLGIALLLSLWRTLDSSRLTRDHPLVGMAMIALVSAALFTLKNTFLAPTALILTVSYLVYLHWSRPWRRALAEGVLCAVLLFVLLIPWMLSLERSSDTLLYPFLGKGVDGSQYGVESGTQEFRSLDKKLLLLRVALLQPMFLAVAGAAALVFAGRRRTWFDGRGAIVALSIGCGVAAIIIVQITTATGLTLEWGANRYCFPILIVPFLALLSIAAGMAPATPTTFGRWRSVGLIVISLWLGWSYWPDVRKLSTEVVRGIRNGLAQPALPSTAAIRRAQEAIPPGEVILARLDYPFLLDFERNPIFTVDHPTMVSPPPGMPAFEGGEAVADYLHGQGIRFVMFSYANEARYSARLLFHRLNSTYHPVWRNLAIRVFDFNKSLQELGRTRRRVWDDRRIFVLDLHDRVDEAAASRP